MSLNTNKRLISLESLRLKIEEIMKQHVYVEKDIRLLKGNVNQIAGMVTEILIKNNNVDHHTVAEIDNIYSEKNMHVKLMKSANMEIRCNKDHIMSLIFVKDLNMDEPLLSSCKKCLRNNTYYFSNEYIMYCRECSIQICPNASCIDAFI